MNTNIVFSLLLLVCALIVFSCNRNAIANPAYTLNEEVIVERTKEGDYKLYFKDKSVWDISSAKHPKQLNWDANTTTFEGDYIEFPGAGTKGRMYFGVTSKETGKRFIVTERIIPLKGANNFRDIGGIPTKDGSIVKWGKVFRSGKLSDLSTKDLNYMSKLGIKTICDFRNDEEVRKDRDKISAGATYKHFPIIDRDGSEYRRIKKEITSGKLKGEAAKKYFTYIMQQFADSVAINFKPVLDIMIDEPEEGMPLLYHCSGGKDRTGMMTIIILGALGVEKDIIKEEYLMSNFYRYKANKKNSRKVAFVGIDGETARYAFVVQEEYFDGVFDVIENKYGGMDNYLEEKFGVDEARRNILRERYTRQIPKLDTAKTN